MATIICKVLPHKFSLFKHHRLRPSVVHQIRCYRCGKQKGAVELKERGN